MMQPVTLTGTRVQLLPLQPEHASGLWQAAQDPQIWPYLPTRPQSQQDIEIWIGTALEAQQRGVELPFTVVDVRDNSIVGSTRLLDYFDIYRQAEIGWTWLNPSAWRTRINTECKYLLLRYAFESLNLVRVTLKTDARNERSQRAIERLGAVREGVLRRHRILPDGFIRDSVIYSVIDLEWPQVKTRLETLLCRHDG
jgi:RimJ/RimL family protein N-acetyltransferase